MSVALDDPGGKSAKAGDMSCDALTGKNVADGRSSKEKSNGAADETGASKRLDVDHLAASTYNIYHRKEGKEHYIITPLTSAYQERLHPPRKQRDQDIFREGNVPDTAAENTFFVHKPCLSFHHPPRTLRRGPRKDSPAVCLINNSWFWRKWILQFGEQLSAPDVIDPRGVVSADCKFEQPTEKARRVRSYGVRTWRMWGESGKQYHREYNKERKAGQPHKMEPAEKPRKDLITEVVYFSWHSPFTHKPRQYRFDYAGLEFYWKGTGTVKEPRTCGWWMRFHHLKLCVRIPIVVTVCLDGDRPIKRTTTLGSTLSRLASKRNAGFREECLAKYTSSMASKKAGTLQVYDDVLHRLLLEDVMPLDIKQKEVLEATGPVGVKKLRLYEIILATAMCMVIGEWQKREALIALLAAAGEGAN
ncbi:uncharacterized protein PV09_06188 [Verruconis gallopava]|uniref:Uncharacterized protein n=1 Tax=Verruconis gallopava TaxID=253628 RepID=A0A0D1XJ94_9PEZI|nr:uncharacterized protein PV09_06188 [Verruconis gallopava]KIW02366.1 hypothetical protein PV09_06188 [Verruconis gallopava]